MRSSKRYVWILNGLNLSNPFLLSFSILTVVSYGVAIIYLSLSLSCCNNLFRAELFLTRHGKKWIVSFLLFHTKTNLYFPKTKIAPLTPTNHYLKIVRQRTLCRLSLRPTPYVFIAPDKTYAGCSFPQCLYLPVAQLGLSDSFPSICNGFENRQSSMPWARYVIQVSITSLEALRKRCKPYVYKATILLKFDIK